MLNHRPSTVIQSAIDDAEDRRERASFAITSAEKHLGILNTEAMPKSPSLARMDEILKDYNARRDGLNAERQAAINSLRIAETDAEALAAELAAAIANEERLARINKQWAIYDSAINQAAKACLKLVEEGDRCSALSYVHLVFRRTAPAPYPTSTYSAAEIAKYPSVRAHVLEGAPL